MDSWPRIPKQNTGPVQARSSGSSLPPTGSVVMASVEEDLGDGMYSLRWAGNRISVTSRAALTPGQSLILKSELSPEGKPTLVVQGPALPELDMEEMLGRRSYGPAGRHGAEATGAEKNPGQPAAGQAMGGDMAAGVAKASPAGTTGPLASLLGLVLEPLDEFELGAKLLIELAEAEKESWDEYFQDTAKAKEKNPEARTGGQAGKTADAKQPQAAQSQTAGQSETARPAGPEAKPVPESGHDNKPVPDASANRAGDRSGQSQNAAAASEPAPRAENDKPAPEPAARPDARAPARPDSAGPRVPEVPENTRPDSNSKPLPNANAERSAGVPAEPSRTPSPERPDARPTPEMPSSSSSTPERSESVRPAAASTAAAQETAAPSRPDRVVVEQPSSAAAEYARPTVSPSSSAELPRETAQASAQPARPDAPQTVPRERTVQRENAPPPERPDAGGQVKPEVFLKEALTQIVKAAELPLASPSADSQALGAGNKMPEAIVDKAASILVRAAGLTPDQATLEAAKALVENNVQVDRSTVQAMLALAANVPEDERAAILKAAARLSARDIPLAAPLAGGLADIMTRKAGVYELIDKTLAALSMETSVPEARPLMDAAKQLLDMLHVDLEQGDAASALERYISTFGRETMGKALALVEKSAQAVLENHPVLTKIDEALSVILTRLEPDMAQEEAAANPPDPHAKPQPAPAPPAGGAPAQPAAPPPAASPAIPAVPAQPTVPPDAPPLPRVPGQPVPPMPLPAGREAAIRGETRLPSPETGPAPAPVRPGETRPAPAAETPLPSATEPAAETEVPASTPAAPPPARNPMSPINAYLRARPFAGLANMHLPPMPKVATLTAGGPDIPQLRPETPLSGATPPPSQAAPAEPADPDAPAPADGTAQPVEPARARIRPQTLPGQELIPPENIFPKNISPDNASAPQPRPLIPGEAIPPSPSPSPEQPRPAQAEIHIRPVPAPPPPASAPGPQAAGQAQPQPFSDGAPPLQPPAGQAVPAPERTIPELIRDRLAGKELTPDQIQALEGAMKDPGRSQTLMKLDSLFQTPGLNKPELELLRPSGFLDRFLNTGGGSGSQAGRDAASLARDLLSDDPEKREQALRDLPSKDQATLRETAARLSRMEQDIVRQEPNLSRLADAANSLRDLGRQLLAVKAENLAGQDRSPQVMLAEVPFKLNENGGDGRMQMFYRKGKGKQEGWTSRVILDLNTTVLGPVLGDMRFFGSDMVLNMFVDKQDTADYLGKAADQLAENLLGKGFRVKSRFMVLPPPPPAPEIRAERPEMREEPAAATVQSGDTKKRGRLDTKA